MKKIGEFLLAKDQNAIAVAFFCALLSVFYLPTGFIAAIIVGLVTLQKGPKSGLWALAWIALPTIAMLVLHRVGSFDVLFIRCVTMWIFASLLYRYKSWHVLLEWIAITGIALILLLHHFIPHLRQWWIAELTTYIQQLVTASHWKLAASPAEFAARLAPIASGVVLFFFFSSVLCELFVARWWQTTIVNPGSFAKEFIQIRINPFLTAIVLVLGILLLCKVGSVQDLIPLAILPFFIAGLSFLHFWTVQGKKFLFGTIFVYVTLFFLPAFVVSGLGLIALLDSWCHFRKKRLEQLT